MKPELIDCGLKDECPIIAEKYEQGRADRQTELLVCQECEQPIDDNEEYIVLHTKEHNHELAEKDKEISKLTKERDVLKGFTIETIRKVAEESTREYVRYERNKFIKDFEGLEGLTYYFHDKRDIEPIRGEIQKIKEKYDAK